MFRLVVGARVDRFDYIDDFVFSPRDAVHDQAGGGPDVPRLVQPRLPFAVGHQQLPRPRHRAAGQSRRLLGVPEPTTCCRSTSSGNTDLEEQSLDAFEIGYSGVVANGRAICRRRST